MKVSDSRKIHIIALPHETLKASWSADQSEIRPRRPAGGAWRVSLLARYWHFLLLAWLALFACFSGITPEVARIICGAP